jgi:haloacetate dehalogenase
VTRVALLNIVPTVDQFERMSDGPSLGYWPWFLLAQPAPFPERLIGADPDGVLEHVFGSWASRPEAITAERRRAYRSALTPATIASMCGDYRASFHLDREHDAQDRAAGRTIAAPALVVIGEDETQLDPDIWRTWTEDLTVTRVPGGHFIPEEAPEELGEALAGFLR